MINVLINGIKGKMSQMLFDQIKISDKFNCIGGVDKDTAEALQRLVQKSEQQTTPPAVEP